MKEPMKRLFFLLTLMLCTTAVVQAQSYTTHLQQKQAGHGNVSVSQSREIDDLVNNANVSARTQQPADKTSAQKKTADTAAKKDSANAHTPHKTTLTPQHNDSSKTNREQPLPAHKEQPQTPHKEQQPQHKEQTPHKDTAAAKHDTRTDNGDIEEPAVDMRKKVMRRSYKVNGYRVQVFAGGNSRADKVKAQNAGNAVKRAMPEQPVYVHFYSPRWICRVGNFRSYEEANNVLRQVKKLGYKQACIVSGKITVAY